jgi:hypothetical protein
MNPPAGSSEGVRGLAAVKFPDGRVFVGGDHAQALNDASRHGIPESAYWDDARDEFKAEVKHGSIGPATDSLHVALAWALFPRVSGPLASGRVPPALKLETGGASESRLIRFRQRRRSARRRRSTRSAKCSRRPIAPRTPQRPRT